MAIINIIALIAAIIVIIIERRRPKIQLPDDEEDPLIADSDGA